MSWSRSPEAHADELLQAALPETAMPARDRAFARELFFGVLRHLRALDFWITKLTQRPPEDGPRRVLQLGLYQLLLINTPAHAALHATVELAHPRKRGFINAVLRQASREHAQLLEALKLQPPPIRNSHPDFLYQRWLEQFGSAETLRLMEWNNQPAPIYVRLHNVGDQAGAYAAGFDELKPTEHPLVFRASHLPSALIESAHAYVQDPSTLAVCEALAPRPGDRILDACAAPGGKSIYLEELASAQAEIVAAESQGYRLARMRENLKRLKTGTIQLRQIDWLEEPPADLGVFDKILIDAPCSNSGVLRRRVDARWRLEETSFAEWAEIQGMLLRKIAPYLRDGGRLAYSTCSIDPEENEEVVRAFIQGNPRFECLEQRSIRPDIDGVDGAYYAILTKTAAN